MPGVRAGATGVACISGGGTAAIVALADQPRLIVVRSVVTFRPCFWDTVSV
jgi:hypothetical protein